MGQVYQYCHVKGKVVPKEEVIEVRYNKCGGQFIFDEMPPTKNPLNPRETYTSKSKLRERYKEAGVEEIGTAYENGYDPVARREKYRTERFEKQLHENFRRRLNE